MGLADEFSGEEDFREIVHSVHDPFRKHPGLEYRGDTSAVNPTEAYESDVANAAQSVSRVVTGDGIGGGEFIYNFKGAPGRVYLVTPDEPFVAKGDVLAGNFGDPTYRNLDKANPDSILTELEKTYQQILNRHSTEYTIPRETEEVHERGNEFGSVFRIEIPPDFEEEKIERTAQAVFDASEELNELADQLIQTMQTYRND